MVDGPVHNVRIVGEADDTGTPAQAADVTVDGTSGGVVLLAANPARSASTIQNTGAANLRLRVDGDPTPTRGYQLAPGQAMSFTPPESHGAHKAIRESSTSTTATAAEVV